MNEENRDNNRETSLNKDEDEYQKTMIMTCCICGEEDISEDHLHDVEIKGQYKRICDECLDTIHGLV
jgi:hypothetical protein